MLYGLAQTLNSTGDAATARQTAAAAPARGPKVVPHAAAIDVVRTPIHAGVRVLFSERLVVVVVDLMGEDELVATREVCLAAPRDR